jgi:hypothetical protein
LYRSSGSDETMGPRLMKKYSVRKWYYVDTIVEAESPEAANSIVENGEVSLKNLEYYGDIDGFADVAEMDTE